MPTSSAPASRWRRALPGVATLASYRRGWLRGDVLAGITVSAYLVPQVMAYAVIAGLEPVAGLWAIMAPLLVYAIFGSSKLLSVGPEATCSLMTAAGVAAVVGGAGPERRAEAAAALAVATGALCLLGYLGRLGFLAELLSKPVLTGYMAGIALLMIASQLGKTTGVALRADNPLGEVAEFVTRLGEAHPATLALCVGTLAGLFAMARWLPGWPGPLLAMLAATAVVAVGHLDTAGVAVVGAIPHGLPGIAVPDLAGLPPGALVVTALGVAVVGYSDNILTARVFAQRAGHDIDSNQEFLALGLANIAGGLSHGFPVSSSGSRTVLAETMGARSQLHSLVALAGVVATMFFLGPILSAFPSAALAAVVIYAATRLIDRQEWQRIVRFRRSELILALATAAAVILLGVLPGIAVAIGMSIIDLLRRLAIPHAGILGYVPGLAGMHDVEDYPNAQQVPGLVVYRYDSPLFFANAEDFTRRAVSAVDEAPTPTDWFLLNAEANVQVDLTAVEALDNLRAALADRGILFAMARVKHELFEQLAAAGFVDKVGAGNIYPTLPSAVTAYAKVYASTHGHTLADLGVHLPPVT